MKKYDCNKTLDYSHEFNRMCKANNCGRCPFDIKADCSGVVNLSQKYIDILQKWSDEHPEPPKLTKKERTFLECFEGALDERIIKRTDSGVYYCYTMHNRLKDDMFTFIEEGTSMTFEELLKLEVEE